MTGPRVVAGIRRTGPVALLCILAACGPGPAPPRTPATTPDPTSPFRLPATGADGVPPAAATVRVPLLPPAADGTATDLDVEDLASEWTPEEPEEGASDAPSIAVAWPDVDALLDGLDVERDVADGVVTFSGRDAETAGKVLAAAHAALSRTVRVEVVAVRLAPGARPPSAAEALASRGPQVVARLDRELHDGAVLVVDRRETRVFPADADVEANTVTARAVGFEVGPFLAVSPARLDAHRHVLRIAFHASRVASERLVAGDDASRVAPALTVSALVFAAPAVAGRADVAIADAVGGGDGLAVAWRVSTVDDAAAPAGTRALSIHADRLPFVCDAPPHVGVVDLTREAPEADELDPAAVPDLPAAASADVRLVAAEPGIVVASGADAALADFDAALGQRVARIFPAARFRDGGTSIPFVRSGDVALVQGRLDPVVVAPESSASSASAGAATRTAWVFTGRALRIAPEANGARVDVSSSPAPEIATAAEAWLRTAPSTGPASRDVVDALTVRAAETTRHLVPGASQADGLEILAW